MSTLERHGSLLLQDTDRGLSLALAATPEARHRQPCCYGEYVGLGHNAGCPNRADWLMAARQAAPSDPNPLTAAASQAAPSEPYGWVVWWLGGDGQRKPIFHHGAERPSFGAELDGLVPVVAVYTGNAPAAPNPPADDWQQATQACMNAIEAIRRAVGKPDGHMDDLIAHCEALTAAVPSGRAEPGKLVAREEAARWKAALDPVMPADLKCWHQNAPAELPPLPHCYATEKTPTIDRRGIELVCLYTSAQMEAHASAREAAARAQALEDAARVCEMPVEVLSLTDQPKYDGDTGPIERRVCLGIAKRLRALAAP